MARSCVLCGRDAPPGVITCPSCGSEWFTPHSGRLNLRMRLVRRVFRKVKPLLQKFNAWYVQYCEENGVPLPPGMEGGPLSFRPTEVTREPSPAVPAPPACPACSGTCGDEGSSRCRVRQLAAMRTNGASLDDLQALEESFDESAELSELMCFVAPDDDGVYSWKLVMKKEGQFASVAKMVGKHVLGPTMALYGILSAVEFLLPRTAFWISVFIVFMCLYTFHPLGRWQLRSFHRMEIRQTALPGYPLKRHEPVLEWWGKRMEDLGVVMMRILLVPSVAFIIGSPHYWFSDGFSGGTDGRIGWAIYSAQLFINTITFDTLEILGVSSVINPVSIAARASIVLVKTLIAFCIAEIIYDVIRHSREPLTFVGTGDEMWEKVFGLRVASVARILKTGRVAPYQPPYVINWDDSELGPQLRRGE